MKIIHAYCSVLVIIKTTYKKMHLRVFPLIIKSGLGSTRIDSRSVFSVWWNICLLASSLSSLYLIVSHRSVLAIFCWRWEGGVGLLLFPCWVLVHTVLSNREWSISFESVWVLLFVFAKSTDTHRERNLLGESATMRWKGFPCQRLSRCVRIVGIRK